MEYNTQRPQLKITDYGRHVTKMIEYCKTIEDRDERTKMANTIVDVMAHLAPKVKERADYRHTLWDHLMILANYDLDVDCPYEINRIDVETFKPHALNYRDGQIHYRHYGRTLEDMIAAVAELPESEERKALTEQIAHTMKRQYLLWNRDTVDDAIIREQLNELSNGRLTLPDSFTFQDAKYYLDDTVQPKKEPASGKSKRKKKKK